nr:linoleate 13S-lipoxygenase 3-1, chloroplastic [Tanacetum cinerariifolium]
MDVEQKRKSAKEEIVGLAEEQKSSQMSGLLIEALQKSMNDDTKLLGGANCNNVKCLVPLSTEDDKLYSVDRFSWLCDDEFARQALAGVNPVSLEKHKVFPPVSQLDPEIYGPQESALKGHDCTTVSIVALALATLIGEVNECVGDTDGVELIKGSRGSNLYTISVEDMMKSSPICLLSKASKNKSWLWHRRLNHLNFDTINDLARKDLVRGLPRLKFEKDHLCSANMANKNVLAPAPTRCDDQILPFTAWVPIGKSNFVLDLQMKLDANLLREALEITPVDQAHQFMLLPSGDAIMDFVNQLGYPGEIHFVSRMAVNNLYQAWRAILSMINQCLTCKTSGFDRPRCSALQMLWGIITHTNVDNAELMWEEFVQVIQTFLVDKANLGSPTKEGKKTKPHVIPYCQFTKLIIYYLGRHHNIHQRSGSPLNHVEDDLTLENLKFVPKGENDEVFGMKIPNELITDDIRRAPYYKGYLEMVAKHERKIAAEKEGGKKKIASKADKPVKAALTKQAKPTTAKQPRTKPIKDKSTKPTPLQMAGNVKVTKVQNAQGQTHVGGVAIREPIAEATRPHPVVEGKGKDDASANIVHETPFPVGDTEILNFGEEQEEDVNNKVYLEEKTVGLDEGQTGSDPDPGQSHMALVGPNPEPMHDDFVATVYPKVHESLKFPTDEQVILEDPLSSSGTLSSMKNLDDTYTFGDQFFNDKSTEDEPGKQNVDAEVISMVTVPIHQAFTSVIPLSTPIIDLSPPKPVASPHLEPFIAATTTTTLSLPPPPQQQSTTDSELAARVIALEKKFSDLDQKSQTLDNTTQNLRSRFFTLELQDLPYKINQTVDEVVKEAVHVAFQAPLRDRLIELPEADMKEIIHQRMFESGSYKSLPEHVALYEALEASTEPENIDEFLAKKDKSRKRCRDDQDPHLLDSDLSKKKRHDSDASGSKQPPAPQRTTRTGNHSAIILFQKDLEYLISGDTARRVALLISKLKVANYPNFGLEELVPSLWIESERDCNVSAAYGITHWWFKRKEFYITRHSASSARRAVRSHMRIPSVIGIKTFERYGYAYLREIVIRRADYSEYKISEADFKICIWLILKICICFISKESSTTYLDQKKFIYTTQSTCGS